MPTNTDYTILHWGVAGCGRISADFVSTLLLDSPTDHKFVAAASRSAENAREFANTHHIGKSYGSYPELAADSSVQIVYIGNYNTDHYETAKLFLEHGKHVLMEKPLTMNAAQTEAITRLAKEKGLFLMEALWSRFLPAYRFVVEQIRAGAIGKVVHVDAKFGIPLLSEYKLERVVKKQLGGGTILDLGVYTINIVQLAFDNDPPEKIAAVGSLNEDGVDLSMSAALSYSDGRSATISTNDTIMLPNEAVITGTKGTIRMREYFHCCQRVVLNGAEHDFSYPANTPEQNFPDIRGLRFEADEVRRLLLAGKLESEIMPHEDSVKIARIQDELRRQVGVHFEADSFRA